MSYQLPSSQRLKKPAQFQSVYKSKQWGGSKHYTFNVLGETTIDQITQKPSILGVTVSKKVSKRAVDRNRIKRQIREFYRYKQSELTDADIVITAKPSCMRAPDDEREQSLQELWGKIIKWQRWHQRQLSKQEKS